MIEVELLHILLKSFSVNPFPSANDGI